MIELDGSQHFDQEVYDHIRTQWLNAQGYKVIRFWNNDVFENLINVKDRIADELGIS